MSNKKKSSRKPQFPREAETETPGTAQESATEARTSPTAYPVGDAVPIPGIRRASSSKWPWLDISIAAKNEDGVLVGTPFYVEDTTTSQFSSQVAAAQRRHGTKYTVRQLPVDAGKPPRIGVWRIA
jgi:hypothetical protein